MPRNLVGDSFALLAGGGEMGERTRAFDWSRTPVGPIADWPQSLKTIVRTMLDSRYAMWLGWGPDFTFFYNDAYAQMSLGPKHPWALGRPAREVWPEIWGDIGPRAESVLRTGQATWDEGLQLFLERRGFREETYHTFSYSPVPDDEGGVGGLLCVVTEDTERTIGERRLRTLRELGARTNDVAITPEDACRSAAETLSANPYDLPFVFLYLLSEDSSEVRLVGRAGVDQVAPATDAESVARSAWPFGEVLATGKAVIISDLNQRLGGILRGVWGDSIETAVVLPMARPGQARPAGFMVAGISVRRPFNDSYMGFLDLVAGQIATAVANARAYEEERRRAEALAELDRAKTTFFSNVSHEFRTPLTLMLGPVEDMLAETGSALPAADREKLAIAHRNALRLQRLVNTLLDFSRIEAGRERATYEPTDLAALTADLASNFRSACERAGLSLVVDCPPLPEPVFVDRQMWEKVVLNLLSNAFKFTLEGAIEVSVRTVGSFAELEVRDTGIGVPPEEIPHLFERFHRVESAQGRTHEGSGIGLSLVQELIRLHGGSIAVESEVGRGTRFTIQLPLGSAHLPAGQIGRESPSRPTATEATAFVAEALRWLPGESGTGDALSLQDDEVAALASFARQPVGTRARALVADDNADMRGYIQRLLSEQYAVEAVADGEAALAAARREMPDIILSDIMMPRLDGFGMLRELRSDPRLASVPVILLSARAGEESRIVGMEAGADDYVVKPFSARELLARVSAHLQMARLRREAAAALRQSEANYRALAESMPFIVWQTNAAGALEYTNSYCFDYTGLTADEFREHGWMSAIHPEDSANVVSRWEQAFESGVPLDIEFRLRRAADREYRWFRAVGSPVLDSAGRVQRWVGAGIDIHDKRLAEESLREADRKKDEFIATLAHELRNPLAPLRNGLQIIRMSRESAHPIESTWSMMDRQLEQLVRLVDDLLDVSRITRGKIELRRERTTLARIIQQSVETSRPVIDASGHSLTLELPHREIFVEADVTRMAQVFSNLLNNAAKYTEPGGKIRLKVDSIGDRAVISVNDTGIGIPPSMLPHVFEMFTRVDRNFERAQGGLGIGLSIVKRLVEMHDGNIEARSEGDGLGSEFIVRLPLGAAASPARDNGDDGGETAARRRILVVDDNRDAATSLALLLKLLGHEVQIAHDGVEGLEKAESFRPDVILLDIGMPRLNGYETARLIREKPWGGAVELIALTGWGQEDDRRKSHEAGFNTHLVKPVDVATLKKLLVSGITKSN
ncbi:MAG TPA: ATP-binding protein [Planctomycetaceae bacterium]|nr:ATP-binding protein [Planctomycetaceae bacterium]